MDLLERWQIRTRAPSLADLRIPEELSRQGSTRDLSLDGPFFHLSNVPLQSEFRLVFLLVALDSIVMKTDCYALRPFGMKDDFCGGAGVFPSVVMLKR